MLSSINSVRPYSVNNYSNIQNSAKSQPSFGSAASEVAGKSTGFFRKAGRFLDHAKYNLASNSIFMGLFGVLSSSPPSSLKEKLAWGAIFKGTAELTDICSHFERITGAKHFSVSHYPLDVSAWIADGIRAIVKSVQD